MNSNIIELLNSNLEEILNSNLGNIKTGSFTGDGSAKRIDCGFKPSKIIVYSYASTSNCRAFYYDQNFSTSVTYTSSLKSSAAVGTDSISASGAYFRTIDTNGFEIGSQLNISGHSVTWVAIK